MKAVWVKPGNILAKFWHIERPRSGEAICGVEAGSFWIPWHSNATQPKEDERCLECVSKLVIDRMTGETQAQTMTGRFTSSNSNLMDKRKKLDGWYGDE